MEEKKKELQYIKGVGERRAELFKKLGVRDLDALFSYYPRSYEDWSHPLTVAEAPFDAPCCIRARVILPIKENFIRRNMTIYKFIAEDGEGGTLYLSVFNNRFIGNTVKEGEEYLFYGKADGDLLEKSMSSPIIRKVGYEKLRPIYRSTEGLPSSTIEKIIGDALKGQEFHEFLPDTLVRDLGMISRTDAIHRIHFPRNNADVIASRRRLAFEELLILQLALLYKKEHQSTATEWKIIFDTAADFSSTLPFSLTGAQNRVIAECLADLRSGQSMNRLIQGDVGSGKTVVAASLIDTVVANGGQAALMAPTEVLAKQHYETMRKFLDNRKVRVALLVGGMTKKQKDTVKNAIAEGKIDLVVGTHAVLQDDVVFKNLQFVVTDEQHRFGVAQRTKLAQKGRGVHTLVMSATPIPRTLSLILYGDLDLSVLDERPKGRQSIKTYAVNFGYRRRVYTFIKKALDAGQQAYIVCPMIDESDADLAAATAYYESVRDGVFSDYTVGLLHGRMKPKEKETVMTAFAKGDIGVLVATTVIEVGIDVPNATIMLIENAERFGLSALHQLRGRIGRGSVQSTCVLMTDEKSVQNDRLRVMTETTDGFKIADEDLKLRGPGDFIGKRQHGLPDLKIADLATDLPLLRAASQVASGILAKDPKLNDPNNKIIRHKVALLLKDAAQYGYN